MRQQQLTKNQSINQSKNNAEKEKEKTIPNDKKEKDEKRKKEEEKEAIKSEKPCDVIGKNFDERKERKSTNQSHEIVCQERCFHAGDALRDFDSTILAHTHDHSDTSTIHVHQHCRILLILILFLFILLLILIIIIFTVLQESSSGVLGSGVGGVV